MKKIKYIANKLSKTEQEAQNLHFSKELTMYRLLLLITMIAYPFLGYVRTYLEHVESFTVFIQRIVFGSLIGISLILSYKIEVIKTNFYTVIRFFVYLGLSHLTFIALLYGWSFSHTLGVIIVLIGTSFVFNNIKQLGVYLVYSSIIVTITTFNAPKNELENIIVLSLFYALCCIIFVTIQKQIKSQKTIKGNEATISALIENSEGLIWSIDTNLNYIAFNKAYQKFIHDLTKHSVLLNRSINSIQFDKKTYSLFKEAYQKVFKGENVNFKAEIEINNTLKFYSFYLSPIKLEYSKIIGATVFGTDITVEKKSRN